MEGVEATYLSGTALGEVASGDQARVRWGDRLGRSFGCGKEGNMVGARRAKGSTPDATIVKICGKEVGIFVCSL